LQSSNDIEQKRAKSQQNLLLRKFLVLLNELGKILQILGPRFLVLLHQLRQVFRMSGLQLLRLCLVLPGLKTCASTMIARARYPMLFICYASRQTVRSGTDAFFTPSVALRMFSGNVLLANHLSYIHFDMTL